MLKEKLVVLRKKSGYSQQELADQLQVSRQTISNWELGQGAPSLDKALEIAKIFKVSLDDLAEEEIGIVAKDKQKNSSRLLKVLEGKKAKISCNDSDLFFESGLDWGFNSVVKILEVSEDWVRIEYTRTKENTFTQKETVIKLIDINLINGFEIVEDVL